MSTPAMATHAMSTQPPTTPALSDTAGAGAGATEQSLIPRFVALLTPVFVIAAGAVAGWVAQHTGAQLDQGQVATFMVTASSSALAAAWKWLHGWQQHEHRVAQGLDAPVSGIARR